LLLLALLLLLLLLQFLKLLQNCPYYTKKLSEKRAFCRGRLAYLSVIAIFDIICRLSYAICGRTFLGDNLTIGVGEKGAERTLNGELLFSN
jgi:hypothetical protein